MSMMPDTCEIALKEWAGICAALQTGRQSILLRKGGILEGPRGFTPEHQFFWLYPTHLHEAEQGLRPERQLRTESGAPGSPSDPISIMAFAEVTHIHHVADEDVLERLSSFHIWTNETIHKRFHYRRPGLWMLTLRVYRRPEACAIVPTPEQLGCKSWVALTAPLPTESLQPVLTASEHANFVQGMENVFLSKGGGD
jgi:hypothetical protein